MRTRNKAKGGEESEPSSIASSSKEAVNKLLARAANRRGSREKGQRENASLVNESKYEIRDFGAEGSSSGDVVGGRKVEEKHTGQSAQHDANELDWEDGTILTSEPREEFPHNFEQEFTVDFADSPSATQRKPSRRATAEEKESAELLHKVHLLCLLSRGRLVDRTCDDPLIQASLLSLLPPTLLRITEVPKLTCTALGSLVNWFRDNFHVRYQDTDKGAFKSNLGVAIETRGGSVEEVAALSVALFRALSLTTRFVSILDVVSLKPDTDASGCPNTDVPRLDTNIFSSASVACAEHGQASNPPHPSLSNTYSNDKILDENSARGEHLKKLGACSKKNLLKCSPLIGQSNNASDDTRTSKELCDKMESSAPKQAERSKRKGDIEFEFQLEMALSATGGAGVGSSDKGLLANEVSSAQQFPTLFSKRLRKGKLEESIFKNHDSSSAVWSRKLGPPLYWAEVYCGGEALEGRWVHVDAANGIVDGEGNVEVAAAAWRRPLRYVVAFAGDGAKDVTRRYCKQWYRIASQRINSQWWDEVLTPLKRLESAATGGMVLLEVFQPNASSDLVEMPSKTPHHPEVASTDSVRTQSSHECPDLLNMAGEFARGSYEKLNSTMNLSANQDSRVASRNSLEDMELETRAFTEPLPTNQQAYKNHHLYALERWLTKYQLLHPKGPILGYCSGHPVYPRSCVQILQTKQKWLREGLQVRANEFPAKIVKHSKKLVRVYASGHKSPEEEGEGTMELYGKWQLEQLNLPCAVNGIVPKNERGQVDVWSEKCLPPGTVHLKLPRLVPIAKRLEIDYAPAMVGFEFRNGRSYPIFEGIVVCSEFKDSILEAYAEEEEMRETEEKRRNESQALSRWFQLLSSIVTRQRLQNSYVNSPFSNDLQNPTNYEKKNASLSHNDGCEQDLLQKEALQGFVQDVATTSSSAQDHEHVFPLEDQSFDKENSMRTKRCPCGFTVQLEEL